MPSIDTVTGGRVFRWFVLLIIGHGISADLATVFRGLGSGKV